MERMAQLATVHHLPPEIIDTIGSELRWDQWKAMLNHLSINLFVPTYRLQLFKFVVELLQKFPNEHVFVAGGAVEFLNGFTSEFGDIDLFFEPQTKKDVDQFNRIKTFFKPHSFHRNCRSDPDLEYHNMNFHVYSTEMKFDSKHPVQVIILQNVTEGNIGTKVSRRLRAFDYVPLCSSALYFDGSSLTFTTIPCGEGRGEYGGKRLVKYLLRTGLKEKPLVRLDPLLRFIGVKNTGCLQVDEFNFGVPSFRITRSQTRSNGRRQTT